MKHITLIALCISFIECFTENVFGQDLGSYSANFVTQRDAEVHVRFLFDDASQKWMMEESTNLRDWVPCGVEIRDGNNIIDQVWYFDAIWVDGIDNAAENKFDIASTYFGIGAETYVYEPKSFRHRTVKLPSIERGSRVEFNGPAVSYLNSDGVYKSAKPTKLQKPGVSMLHEFVSNHPEQARWKPPFINPVFLVGGGRADIEGSGLEIIEYTEGQKLTGTIKLINVLKSESGLRFESRAIRSVESEDLASRISTNLLESVTSPRTYIHYYLGRSSYDEFTTLFLPKWKRA